MDPLELLSDNSLDDSFFENPAGSSNKSKTLAAAKLKGTDDLFGIKEENEFDFEFKGATKSTPRITKQKPSQSNDNDDDDLGFDPRKPKAGSKANIFDDLLSNIELKRPTTAAASSTAVSRQSTDTTTDNSNWAPTPQTRPKTSFGGRRSSSTVANTNADPLGLWLGKEKDSNVSSSVLSTPKTKTKTRTATTADWLGLGLNAEAAEKKNIDPRATTPPPKFDKPPTPNEKEQVDILHIPHRDAEQEEIVFDVPTESVTKGFEENIALNPIQNTTAQNIIALNAMNMQTVSAVNALQQQESQLSLAAQMKNQEQALLDMQLKQDAMLQQQERKFQTLLQQQILRQQHMEQHILTQQKRINAHIQLMMTQPAVPAAHLNFQQMNADHPGNADDEATQTNKPPNNNNNNNNHNNSDPTKNNIQIEADLKRFQLENAQLEAFVSSLKTNYENEIELIERSYKKQIKVLEEHQTAVENRLKAELEALTKSSSEKLGDLQDEKDKMKAAYDNDFISLKQAHEDELKKLKNLHQEDFEVLKEEHRRMLENVRQAKLLEFAAVQDNVSYLDTIRSASNNLEDLSGNLQGLRDELQLRMETSNRERERKLEARERRLEDAEKRLQITMDATDDEKRRLMELVSSLEMQLGKLSKESADENWLLRQKMAAVETEKMAFEKEKEFTRALLEREEKRIAEQKELQSREAQRVMEELQQERSRLLMERTEYETRQKLNVNNNLETQRLEVEAALKVAQDATRQADIEQQRYYKNHRQIEQEKRQIVDKQNALRAKEEELEQEFCRLHLSERKTHEAQQSAKQAEQNFQQKIQILQQRMRELAEKEANLSQERMLVAQDRIKLHNLKAKMSERKCALCQMAERNEEITQLLSTSTNNLGLTATAAETINAIDNNSVGGGDYNYNRYSILDRQPNVVERLLDQNISESYRKMKSTDMWAESVLDDDSKELALHNLDSELQQQDNKAKGNQRKMPQ